DNSDLLSVHGPGWLGCGRAGRWLVVRGQERQPLAGRQEAAKGDGTDVTTHPGNVSVHEHRVAAGAVKAVRLPVNAAVVDDPWAPRRAAERGREVVDHRESVAELDAGRSGNPIADRRFSPAPGRPEACRNLESDRVEVQGREIRLATAHVLHHHNRLAQPI